MNETQQLERYLQNQLPPEDKLVLDARCLLDAEFRNNMFWQQKAYVLINQMGRKKLKAEIEAVQDRLFSENRFMVFRNKIKNIFK